MPLPKCVVIDVADTNSHVSLSLDRWREIGVLETYVGCVRRIVDPRVKFMSPDDILPMAEKIGWSGRLWRDKKVKFEDAWEATKHRIVTAQDPAFSMRGIPKRGFVIFEHNRVMLIGVVPGAQGQGLSSLLLRSGPEVVVAATYSDNKVAKKLYESVGMERCQQQIIFHKDQT